MAASFPLVNYLALDRPLLVVIECTSCSARFLGRRNMCGSCPGLAFRRTTMPGEGGLNTFTSIGSAALAVPVPFVTGERDHPRAAVEARAPMRGGMPIKSSEGRVSVRINRSSLPAVRQ
jgi:uncharacterized OB-fold protein